MHLHVLSVHIFIISIIVLSKYGRRFIPVFCHRKFLKNLCLIFAFPHHPLSNIWFPNKPLSGCQLFKYFPSLGEGKIQKTPSLWSCRASRRRIRRWGWAAPVSLGTAWSSCNADNPPGHACKSCPWQFRSVRWSWQLSITESQSSMFN